MPPRSSSGWAPCDLSMIPKVVLDAVCSVGAHRSLQGLVTGPGAARSESDGEFVLLWICSDPHHCQETERTDWVDGILIEWDIPSTWESGWILGNPSWIKAVVQKRPHGPETGPAFWPVFMLSLCCSALKTWELPHVYKQYVAILHRNSTGIYEKMCFFSAVGDYKCMFKTPKIRYIFWRCVT